MNEDSGVRESIELRVGWAHACLVAEVAAGRRLGYLTGAAIGDTPDPEAMRAGLGAHDHRLARRAFERLGLTASEADTVWLLACCELDPALSRMVEVANDGRLHQLSRQQVQRILGVAGSTIDRLIELGLVESGDLALPSHRRGLRANDRMVDLLGGTEALDSALMTVATLVAPIPTGVDIGGSLRNGLAQHALIVTMGAGVDGQSLLRGAAHAAGHPTLEVVMDRLPAGPAGLDLLAKIARDCALLGAIPLLLDADAALGRGGLLELGLHRFTMPVLATSTSPPAGSFGRPVVRIEVEVLPAPERRLAWTRALGATDPELATVCASRFRLPASTIGAAARAAAIHAPAPDRVELSHVQRALRDLLEHRIAGLARRVEWKQRWTDLVLPSDQIDLLIELVARVRHRDQVLETWGFGAKIGKGHGIAALLSGPPGTGKSMIAGLVAAELGLDLYQVDLSRIASKYIGETEKQLGALFDAAESGQAMLLFDEADSLFGKRTEVKSSNDRYANLEVNYLLQRIEAFTGICLLTTNHESAIDEAFVRRLALHVRVPVPDEEQRARLWSAMLPPEAPVAAQVEAALAALARDFVMTGGHIKNAVVRAAYLAADDGSAITAGHLRTGARAEYEAMGKLAA